MMRLMLSLLILFLVSNANGNNGEEEANRQRELHPRTHTHTSCSYTKIRMAMFDCLDKALNRERPPVNLTSEYEKSVYGPGDVMPYEDYTDDVHTKFRDCYVRYALKEVNDFDNGVQSCTLDAVCCGGTPSRDTTLPEDPRKDNRCDEDRWKKICKKRHCKKRGGWKKKRCRCCDNKPKRKKRKKKRKRRALSSQHQQQQQLNRKLVDKDLQTIANKLCEPCLQVNGYCTSRGQIDGQIDEQPDPTMRPTIPPGNFGGSDEETITL